MNEKQRARLAILKSSNVQYMREMEWKSNALLQECFNALEDYQIINNENEIAQIVKIIDSNKSEQISHSAKSMILENNDYYVVWDNAQVPVIKCKGKRILLSWDDVMAVAFDTYIVDIKKNQAILFRG